MRFSLSWIPFWDGVNFCVSQEYETKAGGIDDILGCISYLLHWSAFSETRWANVGRSGRLFARSLAGGLEPLWDICMEDDNISHWHLGGFKKATSDVRQYLFVAAFSALPAESVLLEVLQDDRFFGSGASGGGRWLPRLTTWSVCLRMYGIGLLVWFFVHLMY